MNYSVPLWRHPTRADVNILTKERDEADENASASWECMDMGREVVAAILGEDKERIAPMFVAEAIRSACYRAAVGTLADDITPPDAASRRVAVLEASQAVLRERIAALEAGMERAMELWTADEGVAAFNVLGDVLGIPRDNPPAIGDLPSPLR
jgi:hypothetical protein